MAAAAGLVCVLSLATVSSAVALTDEDIYGALRIPFRAPGGRAAAMGGAGLALVDDSAAALFNPARLAAINSPELLLAATTSSHDTTSSSSGLIRFDRSINPFAGTKFETESSQEEGIAPSYLAFAYPLQVLSRPFVVAISRAEALNFTLDARSVNRTTPLSAPVAPSAGDEVLRISSGSLDVDLVSYSMAAGWRLSPTFAVGASMVLGHLDLSSETVGLLADPLQFTVPGMFDPRFGGSAAVPLVTTRTQGSDTGLGFSFGAWWKPHRAVSVATAYRRGSRFGVPATSLDHLTGARESFTNVIRQPDTSAIGVAWTPFALDPSAAKQSLTLALDLERVEYSDILEGLREGENVLTRADFVRKVTYTADDATEARLGLEFRRSFLTWTLALRGGLYTEHDGGLRLDEAIGDVGALQGQSRAMKSAGFFDGRGTEVHGTFGVGARFHTFSFDVGLDHSEPVNRMVASITYHMKRGR